MALGSIRRIIVLPDLGCSDNDYNKSGPRPTTFSGQRAFNFVLKNQGLIDKTFLFDVELLNIIPNGNTMCKQCSFRTPEPTPFVSFVQVMYHIIKTIFYLLCLLCNIPQLAIFIHGVI